MKPLRPWVWLLLPALLAAPAAFGEAHLVLRDGQVLSGRSVELEGELYLLTLESGDVLPLPAPLVREIHRSVKPAQPTEDDPAPEALPILETEYVSPRTVEVLPEDYGVVERPRRLIEMPDGGRSTSIFSRSLVDPGFELTSDYEERPMLDVFGEPSWGSSLLDPNWDDESGFELPEGSPTITPDNWNKSSYRSIWKPKEGFADDDR